MKKFTSVTLLATSLCIAPMLNAQDIEQEKKSPWSFGIKGGINILNNYEYDTGIGLNLGGTVDYQLKNRFFLRSGLEFTGKGFDQIDYMNSVPDPEIIGSGYTTGRGAHRSTLFLQIPLTVGYCLPIGKHTNLTFNAGVYGGIGLGSSGTATQYAYHYSHNENGVTIFQDDLYHRDSFEGGNFDFGLMVGIAIEHKRFSFGVNYEHGLVNQAGEKYNHTMGGGSIMNRNTSLSVGYKF